jgi:transcriptional regulator with XRE-family HTH domain
MENKHIAVEGRKILAKNIIRIRKERGMSSEKLAGISGIGRGYLGRVERCEQAATIDTIDRLAKALSVSLVDLLEEN